MHECSAGRSWIMAMLISLWECCFRLPHEPLRRTLVSSASLPPLPPALRSRSSELHSLALCVQGL